MLALVSERESCSVHCNVVFVSTVVVYVGYLNDIHTIKYIIICIVRNSIHACTVSIRYVQQQRTHSYLLTPATTGHYLYFLVATVLGVYANISLAYLLTRLCEARLTCKLLYAGAVLPLQLLLSGYPILLRTMPLW